MKAQVPGRILVMDDEPSVRSLLVRVLDGAGHQVSAVESGEEALRLLAQERFDLIVADKNLPGMNGLEVLRLARTQHPGLQAILITGFPSEESRETAAALGVHSYVVKPFGILDILGACDQAIALARGAAAPDGGDARRSAR
jgi:CheY-like chemotaxis protein